MSKTISEVISNLRFPMCIAVVCIHSAAFSCGKSGWVSFFLNLLGHWLPSVAVPCFFFISGYLSAKQDNFSSSSAYFSLLKRRSMTLLLPYLIWNIIAFVISLIVNLSPIGVYASGNVDDFSSFSELLIYLFWEPRVIPLWFVRNLILLTIASPVVYYLTKRVPLLSLIVCYLVCCCDEAYFISGLFYYCAGMAARLYASLGKCLSRGIWLFPLFLCWALLSAADIIPNGFGDFIDQPILLAGVIGSISICSQLKGSLAEIFKSDGLVFFVYAMHGIITPYVIKSIRIVYHPSTCVANLSCFFVTFAASLLICISIYALMARYAKSATCLLTGSRL